MSSIYRQVLGEAFERLHPRIQERFGFSSADGIASIGRGVMSEVWKGRPYTLPFLFVGTWRNIMFPVSGRDIPFTIENYAYQDSIGRETVTWIRRFHFPERDRRFDATMVYAPERDLIVDYLGNHQHLAVDIHMSVSEVGGVRLRSGEQRFYEGPLAFRFPMLFSGYANVHEWYDEVADCFRIKVAVHNRLWGPLFGYTGRFDVQMIEVEQVPDDVRPRREERRE